MVAQRRVGLSVSSFSGLSRKVYRKVILLFLDRVNRPDTPKSIPTIGASVR